LVLEAGMALAWNPSLTGAKVEDTFLLTEEGLLNLTEDPSWPTVAVGGRERPDLLRHLHG
jgi:Xaa-Pro aminopeptidase